MIRRLLAVFACSPNAGWLAEGASAVVRREGQSSASVEAAQAQDASLLDLSFDALSRTCCGRVDAVEAVNSRQVPSVEVFSKLWYGKMELDRKEDDFQRPLSDMPDIDKNLRVVMGVLSPARDTKYRDIVRQSWMSQSGVCPISPRPVDGCYVYVAFVIGRPHACPDENRSDMLHLDVEESVSHGKVPAYFHVASRRWPWATHVGKMDIDTFVHLRKLLPKVNLTSSCESYGGALVKRYAGCGLASLKRGHIQKNVPEAKYACMAGSLYLLSSRLAQDVSEEGGYLDEACSRHHRDIDKEDVLTGIGITNYVRTTNKCVDVQPMFTDPESNGMEDPGNAWDHCGLGCSDQAKITQHGFFR